MNAADPNALIDLINRRHGTALRTLEPAPGGESRPWIVIDAQGRRHLLKWSDGAEFRIEQAGEIAQRLRLRGYPIPEYLAVGRFGNTAYAVRSIVPGRPLTTPMHPLDPGYLARIVELNELQNGAAAGLESEWRQRILDSIRIGFEEWCVHQTLRSYSGETAEIVSELERMGRAPADLSLRAADAVHGDFTGANILEEGGRIVAVIDWEGASAGDRAFDLTTLLFYDYLNPRVRDALSVRLAEIASPQAIRLYLAHMIVRQLDWSIRHHGAQAVDHYLGLVRQIMAHHFA